MIVPQFCPVQERWEAVAEQIDPKHETENCLYLSPKKVVTASSDHTAREWDAEGGRALATLTGHQGFVFAARFSPDGKRVVTASYDETARVFIVDLVDLVTLAEHQLPMETK